MTGSPAPAPPQTVLVVDDEEMIRSALERFFSRKGNAVITAGDGLQALDALERAPVDVAIVDLVMPNLNGVELVQRMRTAYPNVRIVIMTGYIRASMLDAKELAELPIVRKPFTLDEIGDAVAAL